MIVVTDLFDCANILTTSIVSTNGEIDNINDMMIYSTGVSFLATILNPWFLSLFEIHAASSKFDSKHLPRLPRTSATRAKKVCADIIRSHSLCCRSEGHRAVVVVATICAVFT